MLGKPASHRSKLAGKETCLNASDRRPQVQLTQEAKIAPDFPSFPDNFCVCRLCQRSDDRFGLNRSFKYMSPARPEGWPFVPPPIYDSGGTPVKRTCPAQRALSRFSRSASLRRKGIPLALFPRYDSGGAPAKRAHSAQHTFSRFSESRFSVPGIHPFDTFPPL